MVVGGRTVVTSVARVLTGPPANIASITAQLTSLRVRFPGATFDRYLGLVPTIAPTAHVFPTAAIIADVKLAEGVSVWYGCVLRGDINRVEIG